MTIKVSTEVVSLGSQRQAIEAQKLCDQVGRLLDGKDEETVAAVIMGIICRLSPALAAAIVAAVADNAIREDISALQLPLETQQQIDSIVKGPDHEQEKQPA